jgi:hypothetical protein
MRRWLSLLLALAGAASAAAQPAAGYQPPPLEYGYPPPAEPPPRSGLGALIVGSIGMGIGTLNLATLPVCFADFFPSEEQTWCVAEAAVFAGLGLGVGIPVFVLGRRRRAAYKEWQRRQPPPLRPTGSLRLQGTGMRWELRF